MVQFNFTFDLNVSLEQRLGFELAAAIWSQFLLDDVSVNLHIVATDSLNDGKAVGGAVPLFHEQNYGIYQEYLQNDATSVEDALVIDSQQEGNTVDVLIGNEVVDGNSTILLTSAQAKALGMEEGIQLDNGTVWDRDLVDPNALDGYILINNSFDWSYDFTREEDVPENHLDFLTMALHEIGHALGFVSGLDGLMDVVSLYSGQTQAEGFTALDLLRYTDASQVLENPDGMVADLTVGVDASFSLDGETELATFSTGQDTTVGGDGYQASHWERFKEALGIMDPTLGYQERTDISQLDLQAFDALGWDINYSALDHGLDLNALYTQAVHSVSTDLGIQMDAVSGAVESGQDWYSLRHGSWWQAFKEQMIELGHGSWWAEFEDDLMALGHGSWWQALEEEVLTLGHGSWWQIVEAKVFELGHGSWWQQFEDQQFNLGHGSWWQQFEPQMLEQSFNSWWQIFEQQMLSLGHGSWWQAFEEQLLGLGHGSWWQAFEDQVLELGHGSWWQAFEETVFELGHGSWWQAFESDLMELRHGSWWQTFELGHGSWWQMLELRHGSWWQDLDPFLATLDSASQELSDEDAQVARGGVGGSETEIFYGGDEDDIIAGNEKQDRINAGDGDDLLDGKAGHDVLWGEGGRDLIYGQRGNDLIYGGADDDLLLGEEGEDELYGDSGDDILRGGQDHDILSGGDGRDDLKGGSGRDVLSGDAGNDRLDGETGNDIVIGGEGRDKVDGSSGHDLLYGDTYLGAETLKQLRALLKQQPADTSDNATVETPANSVLNPIRVEAEAMTLSGDYTFRTNWNNDSGDTLKVLSTATGTTTFTGPSGNYMVVARYNDEDDAGNATLDFSLNGAQLNSLILDQDTGQYHIQTVVQNLSLMSGDVLSVVATADGVDNVNLDYLEFVPLDNLIVTQLEPTENASAIETTTETTTEGNTLRVEAESMLLVGDYSPSDYGFSSGGQLIELSNQGQGKAITTFAGETGFYDVVVSYHDEIGDGIAHISASLDGVELDSWLLDQNLDSTSATANNLIRRTVADGIALSTGDIFELAGLRGEGDEDEPARIDYLEFIKVDAPTLALSNPTVVPDSTATDQALVAHWAFDETDGTVATDQTGIHHATLTNTVTDDSQWSIGAVDGALQLDGVNDYVAIANSDAINLGTHGQRTISLWFQVDDATISDRKQVIYEEGGTTRGLNIYIHDGKLYVGGWNKDNSQSGWVGTFLETDDIVADEWHHVALVLDGDSDVKDGALTGYLDGDVFGIGAGSQLWQHGDNIAFGAVRNTTRFHDGTAKGTSSHGFGGYLDDAYIYNQALTVDEISDLIGRDNDQIQGGTGNDIAFGGEGNDVIYGETQTDISSFTLSGTQSYNGHTYLLSQASSWEEAQAEARRLGGNLVTINNAAEEDWVRDTFSSTEQLWIGINDSAIEGQFEWVSGEAVTYTNWAPGEPSNSGGGQDYGTINYDQKWDDAYHDGSWNWTGSEWVWLDGLRGIIEINTASNDTLFGDSGNDTVYGQAGNDALYGDTLNAALSEGLVLHWDFDEGIGNSTDENTGETNDTGWLWGNANWTDGKLGGAVELSGFDSGISANDSTELDITRQLTLASWINADSFDGWDGIITKGTTSSPYALQIQRNESFEYYLSFTANWGTPSGGVGGGSWKSHTPLQIDQWQHVAATYDGEAIRFYIDGQLDSNVVYVDLEFGTNNEELVVGADLPGGDEYFDGAIDEVRVYNRALSHVEMAALAGGDVSGAYSAQLADGATTDLSLSNGVQADFYTGVLDFDGTDDYADIAGLETGGAMTFSAWVNYDSINFWSRIFDFGDGSTSDNILLANKGNTNTLEFHVYDEGSLVGKVSIDNFGQVDTWTYVTATIDESGLMRVYKDGELAGESTATALPEVKVRANNYIGKSHWSSDLAFDGQLESITVLSEALDETAVADLYNNSLADKQVGGNDALSGGGGNDQLVGGMGNDVLDGSDAIAVGFFEKDTLIGGAGSDTFILGNTSQAYYQGMGDRDYALIKDFNSTEDRLQLYGSAGNYSQEQQGSDLYLYYNGNGSDLVAIFEQTTSLTLNTSSSFV